jgi:hypothetical protein
MFRWWVDERSLLWKLEHHARDPYLRPLAPSLVRDHPGLRRHAAALRVREWDLWGWVSIVEGDWRPRRLVALFPYAPWLLDPHVLCLDGPTDSPHRNAPLWLCLYYPSDPPERRWKLSDGLGRLFDLARMHVWCEHIWRKNGRRPEDWPTPQAPHGKTGPASLPQTQALSAELNVSERGRPLAAPFR